MELFLVGESCGLCWCPGYSPPELSNLRPLPDCFSFYFWVVRGQTEYVVGSLVA